MRSARDGTENGRSITAAARDRIETKGIAWRLLETVLEW